MEGVIVEHKREESLDYLKILKALIELPFHVGKNLLTDFLRGNYKNKSITSNNLDELHYFGSLDWEAGKIFSEIDNLVANGMIEWTISNFNQYVKLLNITVRGQNEIVNPTMPKKRLRNNINYTNSQVTFKDKQEFEEFNGFLEGYNDEQCKAIISSAKNILCVAGAGTGKTTVLTKRIEFLIKKRSVSPNKILAVTFTRKARGEMEKRLRVLGIEGVRVNTFNSFCEGILRKYERQIYGRSMAVQGYADKILAINLALANLGLDMDTALDRYFTSQQRKFKTKGQLSNNFMNDCFSVMEFFKLSGQEEYDFSKDAEPKDKDNAKRIYRINKYLKEHMDTQGLRDYSDQMIDAITFLEENPEKTPLFEHVLVDEYQDVNALQIKLLHLLHPQNIFVVGDPRQSIFGWRGSNIKHILDFEKEHEGAEVINLVKNYRSCKKIVDFMNSSIKEMGLKDLTHHHEFDDSFISLQEFDNEHSEREFVIKKILESNIPREEIFVLSRTNRQIMELSQLMKAAGIEHVLKTDEIHKPVEAGKGHVTLATVHAIKGLEARKVFLIGASEQNFPCKASDHPAIEMVKVESYNKAEEEKRLFYVAISRAKERLHITYTGKKPTYFITSEMKSLTLSGINR